MHLAHFKVLNLFGQFSHEINFPELDEKDPQPTVLIIHGVNGVGKTRVLAMIDGMMALDFNSFRGIPFDHCQLEFNTGQVLHVESQNENSVRPLQVTFENHSVLLHPEHPGPLHETDQEAVDAFRKDFLTATQEIDFELIDTSRLLERYGVQRALLRELPTEELPAELLRAVFREQRNPKARRVSKARDLSTRMRLFMREAYADYRSFFASKEPDLFERIIRDLARGAEVEHSALQLRTRIDEISRLNDEAKKFNLPSEQWRRDDLLGLLQQEGIESQQHVMAALSAYVEAIEARSMQRHLVTERLTTFEELVNGFFEGKSVAVDFTRGLSITLDTGEEISEGDLSSGEYHLLYLLVTSVTTRRRGTVIAIDEPEMSLHIAWQRKLVGALCQCASGAEPQFLFATHSPDIAANYKDSMVSFGVPNETYR